MRHRRPSALLQTAYDPYVSYSLHSLKGGYMGDTIGDCSTIGVIKGDTRNVDHSSCEQGKSRGFSHSEYLSTLPKIGQDRKRHPKPWRHR